MSEKTKNILSKTELNRDDIIYLLSLDGEDKKLLFKKAKEIKAKYSGNITWFRGLIEFSNICSKNCYYCGIRCTNRNQKRYELSEEDVLKAAKFAVDQNWGSVVLQAGERSDKKFTKKITSILKKIKNISNNPPGITISLGEQSREVFKEWFDAGAHRYLLRIESSTPELYHKLHPEDQKHSYENRIKALHLLKDLDYQTGTGVMIGTPFQTIEHLADDLIFMRDFDIDMCGMGPYIGHEDAPLYKYEKDLMPLKDRFDLTLKMIAILRIMMKDVNIAAATALQAIDPIGREKAIMIGANVLMPNITPGSFRDDYKLYDNKPCTDEDADECSKCMEARLALTDDEIGYGEWGDPKHYFSRKNIS